MYTNAFQHTKMKGNLLSKVKVTGLLLAGLPLKRELEFRGYVYFQAVCPQLIENALNWLKHNDPLYHNVTTDMNNINLDLKNLGQSETSHTDASIEACCSKLPTNETDNMPEKDDPLNEY